VPLATTEMSSDTQPLCRPKPSQACS